MMKKEAPSAFVARLADHFIENAVDVPRAVQHTQHLDAARHRLIENNVT
jgi:hypothetical protein